MHFSRSMAKFTSEKYVTRREYWTLKERINTVIHWFTKALEDGFHRDSFMCRNLLETHEGRSKKTICRKEVNTKLIEFSDEAFGEGFPLPDLKLSMADKEEYLRASYSEASSMRKRPRTHSHGSRRKIGRSSSYRGTSRKSSRYH